MKEQIITEIAEILRGTAKADCATCNSSRHSDRQNSGTFGESRTKHCKTRKIEKSREVIPCSLFLFGFSSTNFSPVFYEPCFKFWAINIRTTTCSEKLIALIFAFSASARIVGE